MALISFLQRFAITNWTINSYTLTCQSVRSPGLLRDEIQEPNARFIGNDPEDILRAIGNQNTAATERRASNYRKF